LTSAPRDGGGGLVAAEAIGGCWENGSGGFKPWDKKWRGTG